MGYCCQIYTLTLFPHLTCSGLQQVNWTFVHTEWFCGGFKVTAQLPEGFFFFRNESNCSEINHSSSLTASSHIQIEFSQLPLTSAFLHTDELSNRYKLGYVSICYVQNDFNKPLIFSDRKKLSDPNQWYSVGFAIHCSFNWKTQRMFVAMH